MIDIKEAKKLAKLSRLSFTDEELQTFVKEFEATLEQVKAIDKVDVSGVDLKNSSEHIYATDLREDKIEKGFTQEEVVSNAPSKKDGAFLVPITVDEEGGK